MNKKPSTGSSSQKEIPKNDQLDEDRTYEPEAPNRNLKAKGCDCANCVHWQTSVGWERGPQTKFENTKERKRCIRKYEPLIANINDFKPLNIVRQNYDNLSKIAKESIIRILVHSLIKPPNPISLISETYFHKGIQEILVKKNYKTTIACQSFAWPAIFRQMDVFMISGPETGKTIAYLSAVLSFALEKEEKYSDFAKFKGPLVIILCPNSQRCGEIFELCQMFYGNIHFKPKVSNFTAPLNIGSMDVLITMPKVLIECLKRRTFNLKRLCHLVLEDAAELLHGSLLDVYTIFATCNEMLKNRAVNRKVQLVAVSRSWSTLLEQFVKHLYVTPVVCIADFLEASLYGGVELELIFTKMALKEDRLIDHLRKKKYKSTKTIVVCDNYEIQELNRYLVKNGFSTLCLSDYSSKNDTLEIEENWVKALFGDFHLLLVTDFILSNFLTIDDAVHLVHFSMPKKWNNFIRRFSCLIKSISSPLEDPKDKTPIISTIFMHDLNNSQLRNVLNLAMRLEKKLPTELMQLMEKLDMDFEEVKQIQSVELCASLKLFGNCQNWFCEQRHILNRIDNLPNSGKITFKIIKMLGVTSFMVQILTHVDCEGKMFEYDAKIWNEGLDYGNEPKIKADKFELGKLYAHCEYCSNADTYSLVQCIKRDSSKYVEVQILDRNTALVVPQTTLYQVPINLAIVEVYIANLVPKLDDSIFSTRAHAITLTELERNNYKSMIFTGNLQLQIENVIYLHNVIETSRVGELEVCQLNIKKILTNKLDVVEEKSQVMKLLYEVSLKNSLSVPKIVPPKPKKTKIGSSIKAQRAFIPEDHSIEVLLSSAIDPHEVYLRIVKFQDLLDKLEMEIAVALSNFEIPNEQCKDLTINNYYLAPEPQSTYYSRCMLLKLEDEKAQVYFVDYGDEAIVPLYKIRQLPNLYVNKLPFQAIQCSLYGIEPTFGTWTDKSVDLLYKRMFEPEIDFFRKFHAKLIKKEKATSARSEYCYQIILKDCFDADKPLINKLLVQEGCARGIAEIADFEIPDTIEQIDEIYNGEEEEEPVSKFSEINQEDSEYLIENGMELVILDAKALLDQLLPQTLGLSGTEVVSGIESDITYNSSRLSIEAGSTNSISGDSSTIIDEEAGISTPHVFWSQSESKIKLKIKLIDCVDYKISVMRNVIFNFSANLKEIEYKLKFPLHKLAKLEKHVAYGQEVIVWLKKVEQVEWEQLTAKGTKLRNVQYEVLEKKKVKKLILQLDISEDEDEGSDEDDRILRFVDYSDDDSEFDGEVADLEEVF